MVGSTEGTGRGIGAVSPGANRLLGPRIMFGGVSALQEDGTTMISFPQPLTGDVNSYICQCTSVGVPARIAVDNLTTNSVQIIGDMENTTFNWVVIKIN